MVAPFRRIGFVPAHVEDCAFYCDEGGLGGVGSCRSRELSALCCRDATDGGMEERWVVLCERRRSISASIPSHSASSSYVIGSSLGGSSCTGCLGVNCFFSGSEAGTLASAILTLECRYCHSILSYRTRTELSRASSPVGAIVEGLMMSSSTCYGGALSNQMIVAAHRPRQDVFKSPGAVVYSESLSQVPSTTSNSRGNS